MTARNKLYFASDVHLGANGYATSREREARVVRWLDTIKTDAAEVYLMGDVFDFWFEYKTVVPKGYIRFLGKLAELVDTGIKLHLFKGNHDMWMFDYFERELGAVIVSNELEIERNGKKFFLHHGDGLGPGDNSYKLLKKIFRSNLCQWLFARVHPNLGVGIANYWSRHSKLANQGNRRNVNILQGMRERMLTYCRELLKITFYDYLIFGHQHMPAVIALDAKSTFVNLGDWVSENTYAV